MIDLSNHNEDLIRDANTWKPLNVYPLERVMVFESGSQSYFVYRAAYRFSERRKPQRSIELLRLNRRRVLTPDGRTQPRLGAPP